MLQPEKMKQRGFSLTETMIALGLISTITWGVMNFMSQASDDQMFTEMKSNQMATKQSLMRSLSKMTSLKRSIGKPGVGNQELERCLDAGAGEKVGNCTAIGEDRKMYFNLYGADGTILAGTQNNPVSYNRSGKICLPKDGVDCPFTDATAYFWGTCAPKNGATLSSCLQASNVIVKFDLKPVKDTFLGRPLKESGYKIMHRVQHEALATDQDCEKLDRPGLEVKNIANGITTCKCRAGYKKIGTTPEGDDECEALGVQACPGQELLRGRTKDGLPICIKAAIICTTTDFDDESATCSAGGWLENIDLGVCRPKAAGKKAAERTIKCDNNRGKCCHYDF